MILGVIADDFTGATDMAGMLVKAGMRTVQTVGVPDGPPPAAEAVVVALKSRTVPADQAVRESLDALRWLRSAGARRFLLKICSTFDSTPRGNIGPVAEALMDALEARIVPVCPAFPENGRTVYRGHLFVNDALLSESGMQAHPLTPMTDPNLVRVLQAQCARPVGLVRQDVAARGSLAVHEALAALRAQGMRLAIVDAIGPADLLALGEAGADLPLLVGGSGLAAGLPPAYARRGWLAPDARAARLDAVGGRAAVLAGSCSVATNGQVRHWLDGGRPAHRLDATRLVSTRAVDDATRAALDWARPRLADGPVLIHATASAEDVRAAQAAAGPAVGERVEAALALIARGLERLEVRRLVVAGGETAGAVVKALGVSRLRIGELAAPGVPWTQAEDRPLLLALKSGNFGGPDFFTRALGMVR